MVCPALSQHPRQAELGERDAAAEPRDRGDPVSLQGQDQQRVRSRVRGREVDTAEIVNELETAPWDMRGFTVRDPDGNLVGIFMKCTGRSDSPSISNSADQAAPCPSPAPELTVPTVRSSRCVFPPRPRPPSGHPSRRRLGDRSRREREVGIDDPGVTPVLPLIVPARRNRIPTLPEPNPEAAPTSTSTGSTEGRPRARADASQKLTPWGLFRRFWSPPKIAICSESTNRGDRI
jgi:hypothetical protein